MKNCDTIGHMGSSLWTPVRVKARREKKLAEYCTRNNINFYLPLRRSLKRHGKRTFEFWVPMFLGYVFCQLTEDGYKKLLKSDCVLFKVDVDECIERKVIEELNDILKIEALSSTEEVEISPELVCGKKVRITGGPLSGISGYVETRREKLVVSVNVEMLGQSVSVMLDVGDVELEDE